MNSHLSEGAINDYLQNRIAANELLAVDDHIAECDACAQAVSSKATESDLAAATIRLENIPSHLSFEVLESLANGSIEPVEKEIAAVHLARCEPCSESLKELTALRKELEFPSEQTATDTGKALWKSVQGFFKPAYLMPAIGLLLVGAFGIWWITINRTAGIEQVAVPAKNDIPLPATESTSDNLNNHSIQPTDSTQKTPVVASVNDGGTKIEVYSDGEVSGISSTLFESRVRRALARQELFIPADARQFSNAPGVLMGSGSDGVPFALSSPVGKIIETTSPRFVWKPLAGADSYRVDIFDENFNRIASSPQLKSTSWQVQPPLPRGRVFGWQVTAIKDGAEVKSPVRPAPDARFKVLDAESSNAIASARRSGSKLVLGIAYAEAGLLADAEREFNALLRTNPDSAIVRSLLQKVRSAR